MFFFFNSTATTEIYTLSLHDALPISSGEGADHVIHKLGRDAARTTPAGWRRNCVRMTDRKSTRLNSSHMSISYAVFCLKKKKNTKTHVLDLRRQPMASFRTPKTVIAS